MTREKFWTFVSLALAVLSVEASAADQYPSRPITLIVPMPAGGGVDALARMVGDKLSAALNQQIVIDNRPGGGGNIGTRAVAKAEPDGYTLLLGHTGTISINPSLYANAGYDSRKDFAPVGLIAQMPVVLLTHPSVPVKSVPDLIALAKKEPGKLNIGTSTIGSGGYLSAQLFKSMAGVDMTIVPYKGTAPLASDLVGGHVPVAFNMLSPTLGNIRAGNLRALAVASATRTALLPDVPTVAESGLPDFEAVLHYGLLAPVGTPRFIVDRLNKELRTAVNSEDVRKRIASEGGDPLASTPEEYAADIDREEAKWAALVRRLGLKVE